MFKRSFKSQQTNREVINYEEKSKTNEEVAPGKLSDEFNTIK